MLAYLARTLPVIASAIATRDGSLVSSARRRVWPHELDLNLHMNQARYAQVMELSRTDLVLRSGAWQHWRAHGLSPVVAHQTITYRRELTLGQGYVLTSRCVGANGRLAAFETHILVNQRVHAVGEVGLLFVGPDGVLDRASLDPFIAPYTTEPLAVKDWLVHA